ncbi:YdaU family protein [Prosthecochloris sp.]|uniref:YdaU family protein n=1 Tax=Prosthecochloris sp. TaxID=290513 RepID=UPI00257D1A55|nr:YdaU family protein [Prosthecochloris sp.]
MKYYKHHIGDFDQSTRHLTRIERSIYRDLIELYYDTEKPLPLDLNYLCRKIIARSDEERTSVQQVLNEFFTKVPDGWYHDRCEEEIETYHNNQSKRSEAGKASAEARKQRKEKALNKRSTSVEQASNKRATNHKPLTTNHKPIIERDSAKRGSITCAREDALPSLPDVVSFFSAAKLPIYQAEQYYAHLSRDGPIPDWRANAMVWAIDNINKHKRTNHAGNTAQQNGDPHAIANWKFVEACEQQHTGTGKINPRK